MRGCARGGSKLDENAEIPIGRKAATQARILDASVELFLRRGFDRTSITQIAAKAGVGRATIFWHFGDKETLFREAGKKFLVPFREALGGRLSHLPPRKRLDELFTFYEQFVENNRERVEASVRWMLDSPTHARLLGEDLMALHESFRAEVYGALRELVEDDAEADAIAAGLVSLMDGNLLLGLFDRGEAAEKRRRVGLARICERLLAEAKGR